MLFLNEIKFAIRQPSVITVSFVALLLGLMFGTSILGEGANPRDLYQIYSLQQMLILPLLVAVLVTKVFLRDVNSDMSELIGCTPLSDLKRAKLRLSSIYTFASLPMLLIYCLVGFVFYSGEQSAISVVIGYLVFFAPNLFLMSALIVSFAKYSNNNFAIYAFSAFMGVGYLVLGGMLGFPFLSEALLLVSLYIIRCFGSTRLVLPHCYIFQWTVTY